MIIEFRKKNGSFIAFTVASLNITSDELAQLARGEAPPDLVVVSVIKGGHEKPWWSGQRLLSK